MLNSTHQYSVPNIIDFHNYRWKILDETNSPLRFKFVKGIYIVSVDGYIDYMEGAPIKIKWEGVDVGKRYSIVLTEENKYTKCSVDVERDIVIIGTALSIKFREKNEYRCSDDGNAGFYIPLSVEHINKGCEISLDIDELFPFTIEFILVYCDGREEKEKRILEKRGDLLFLYEDYIPGFIEDQSRDHLFVFRFKSVKDRYGADVAFDNKTVFTFGAYMKPVINKITFD